MKNKFLRLLAVIGALWSVAPKATAAESKENSKVSADLTFFARAEQVDDGSTFGDMGLKPHVSVEKDEYKAEFLGSFYNSAYTNQKKGEWLTLMSRLKLENKDWELQVGRMQLYPAFTGFIKTPLTTTLDNELMAAGTTRTFTGTRLSHKGSGLGVGLVANDTRMTPSHWDTGLLTWEKRLSKEWGLAAHIGAGDKGFHNAGFTACWTPTDKTSMVAEGIYAQKATHGILGIQHKLTDDLAVFAGTKISKENEGKLNGWITAGASYNLGKGFSTVAAVKQDVGGNHKPHGIIGLRYCGNFGITGL